jgi:flagellar protein FliO/FliZ
MAACLSSTASGFGQTIVVLLITIFVLVVCAWVTKWIGNYQKEKAPGENILIVESKRIAPNKFVEIIKIGEKYYALGIGKDEMTLIDEIDGDTLKDHYENSGTFSFKDFLNKAKENGVDKSK